MPDTKNFTFNNSEFAAMISHDMKTPVKAQIRALNLLNSGIYGEFSDEAKNLITNIIASNKYLQTLLDNVLDDFRINGGNFVLNPAQNDLRKTVEDALLNVGVMSEVRNQTVSINYLCQNFIKTYDEIEIKRVIINLLANAFEHGMENSEILITLEDFKKGVKFSVKNYPGANRERKAGAGLGLEICKKIIALHNGEFSTSTEDNGKFNVIFSLP